MNSQSDAGHSPAASNRFSTYGYSGCSCLSGSPAGGGGSEASSQIYDVSLESSGHGTTATMRSS
ncbi:hypothetical protein I7I48_02168 [Histoplasma ohiense]|nr:hypothetical protein I7I48_02168 [Histoplasma ohiense (nom. inval.)]